MAKITNDTLFTTMEIFGLVGLDVELDFEDFKGLENMNESQILRFGLSILEGVMKNSKKAQPQIEWLLKDLTGFDTSKPLELLKAIKHCKDDEEVRTFFIKAADIWMKG